MEKSDTIANLAKALAQAQGSFKPARMNAVNPFLKNKYADLGAIIETAKDQMKQNGLAVSQLVDGEDNKVTLRTVLMHESGEWLCSTITLPIDIEKGRSFAQSMGALVTYMRRYALSAILGLYADEDIDGNEEGKQNGGKGRQEAPQAPPAAQPTQSGGNGSEKPAEAATATGSLEPWQFSEKDGAYDEMDTVAIARHLTGLSSHKPPSDLDTKKIAYLKQLLAKKNRQ